MPVKKNPTVIKLSLSSISTTRILVGLLLVAVFFLGVLTSKVSYLEKNSSSKVASQPTSPNQPAAAPAKLDVDAGHLQVLGNKNAKVTLVEFADFRCPFCERWFKDVKSNLMKDYIDTGKVKFAFRHFAFLGQQSTWAAEASECANEQNNFWGYHDYLYNNQALESNLEYYSKDNLIKYAGIVGLDTDKFASCLNSDKYAKAVADDLAGGQKAGVNGTPSVFVNGQILVGAQPYASLKTLIDQELAKAK